LKFLSSVLLNNSGKETESEFNWKKSLEQAETELSQCNVAAIIVDPLIQGAGGMLMYP